MDEFVIFAGNNTKSKEQYQTGYGFIKEAGIHPNRTCGKA
jgi:hypothetical protein